MSAFPAIAAVMILGLQNQEINWLQFIRHGEAPIYCIGLLVSAVVLTARELKTPFAQGVSRLPLRRTLPIQRSLFSFDAECDEVVPVLVQVN